MHIVTRSLLLLSSVLAFAACTTDEEATGVIEEPLDAWTACTEDADCVAIDVGCCDHCNGGRLVGVNAASSAEAAAAMRPSECTGGCTERACTDTPRATCDAGVCAVELVPDCRLLSDCSTTDACVEITGTSCTTDASAGYGCIAADATCGQALTCAIDPSTGDQVVFPNTCVPLGWASCGSECSMATACAGLGRAECDDDPACTALLGTDCLLGDTVYGGCVESDGLGCDDVVTCRVDPRTGRSVNFPDSCVPGDWVDECGPNSCSMIP